MPAGKSPEKQKGLRQTDSSVRHRPRGGMRACPLAWFALCSYGARMPATFDSAPRSGPLATDLAASAAPDARAVARGICRLFARNGVWCLPEMPLRSGRRADLMGVDAKGRVVIVEIKVSRADLLGDAKWTDYLDHCDRFYWGLSPTLDRACLESEPFRPSACGVIVADGYDAEVLRAAPEIPLAAVRRKAEVERLARVALRRQLVALDPACGTWGED